MIGITDSSKMGPDMENMINSFELHVVEIESADTGNILLNGLITKSTLSVYPF